MTNTSDGITEPQDQFRLLFELAPIGMAMTTLDGRFLRVNQAFAVLLGYTTDELVGKTCADVIHPDDRDGCHAAMRGLRENTKGPVEIDNRYARNDGQLVNPITRVAVGRTASGEPSHFILQVVDIAGHKRLEEPISGLSLIAHDLNNLLTAILGYSDVLLLRLGHENDLSVDVVNIKKAGENAASLTRRLVEICRGQPSHPAALDLGDASVVRPTGAGTETILVVEDEPLLLTLAVTTLEEQGYTVLQATNGEDALRVCEERADQTIDLLITDVVMPEMDGTVLAQRLGELRPDIKTLYVSGYTRDNIATTGAFNARSSFLSKPFSLTDLSAKVREVLDMKP